MENNIKIPKHVKIELQKSVEIQRLGIDQKETKSICWTYTCSFDVFFKKLHNNRNDANLIAYQLMKWFLTCVHRCNRVLFSHVKTWDPLICVCLDGAEDDYVSEYARHRETRKCHTIHSYAERKTADLLVVEKRKR